MSTYQHILVGLDLSENESKIVLDKAKQLAKANQAKLSIVHVVEPLTFSYPGDIPVDLSTTQMASQKHSEEQLAKFTQAIDYPLAYSKVVVGQTAPEMRQLADDIGADLIAVGSHGRHGLALLLGSTASDLLHGAKCDVLAIKV